MSSSNIYFEQIPLEIIEEQIIRGIISDRATNEDALDFDTETELSDDEGLQYPQWQRPLQQALLEINGSRLKGRVSFAEAAIANRLKSIAQGPENYLELQAIADAQSSLRILKRDILAPAR